MDVCDVGNIEEMRLIGPVQPINYASIAKVCDTDAETIEIIIKEIVSQLKQFIKNGASVRLMLKLGRLVCKNGVISWRRLIKDEDNRYAGVGVFLSTDCGTSIGAAS